MIIIWTYYFPELLNIYLDKAWWERRKVLSMEVTTLIDEAATEDIEFAIVESKKCNAPCEEGWRIIHCGFCQGDASSKILFNIPLYAAVNNAPKTDTLVDKTCFVKWFCACTDGQAAKKWKGTDRSIWNSIYINLAP